MTQKHRSIMLWLAFDPQCLCASMLGDTHECLHIALGKAENKGASHKQTQPKRDQQEFHHQISNSYIPHIFRGRDVCNFVLEEAAKLCHIALEHYGVVSSGSNGFDVLDACVCLLDNLFFGV